MIKIQSKIPLAGTCPVWYRGIASDGCWFYLIKQGECQVIRLDRCFQEVGCFLVCRCYACLCYDPCECCFWASDGKCPSVLYRLDECFREVDRVYLCRPDIRTGLGAISTISYDCQRKCLLLVTEVGLVWAAVQNGSGTVLCVRKACQWITAAISAGDSYFVCFFDGCRQIMRQYSAEGETIEEWCVPKEFYVNSAIFAAPSEKEWKCSLYILATKHSSYPYALECVPMEGTFCPALYCPCRPCPCQDSKPCERMLNSIAQMQTALSHILHSEGEKLREVVECTDDPDILLKANQAVSRTIVDATFLEQVLYHKLEMVQDICGTCEPQEDCCENDD